MSSSASVAVHEHEAPLSPSQEGLWFLHQAGSDNGVYHNILALRLQGSLDIAVLQKCLNQIVTRHEALRTRITVVDGLPKQVAAPATALPLNVVDVVAEPGEDPFHTAMRQAQDEASRPFDLAAGPAIRALLLSSTSTDSLLVLTVHHVVSDGTGMTILLRELIALYSAYRKGEPSPVTDLPVGYLEAARQRHERLAGRLPEGVAYWTAQLSGAPPLLELPLDRPRPLVQRFRGGVSSVELPRDLTDAVRAFSRREGVTVYMTFVAALQILLHRYTGQRDILIGSQMTGRTRRELRGMIAYLVNTIVLRTDVDPELTVRQLLSRVRETAVGAFRHADIPFEKVVASLRPPRSRSHHPVFQVSLSYHERGEGWLRASNFTMPGLTVSFPQLTTGASRFDLSVCVHEGRDESLGIDFEYDSDLFDRSTVERMAGHLQRLLSALVQSPDLPVQQLPLLTREEERQLRDWVRGPTITPTASCLHELIEAQTARTPDAVALVHGSEQWTYADLDRRANQLAHHLHRLGARPGQFVGLCLRRSPAMVVGLLGILKSGASYVFVEPGLPVERRTFMVSNTGARIMVVEEATSEAAVDGVDAVVSLDRDTATLDRESTGKPPELASGDDLAYCVYTSGSTGTPKAVGIRHAGCVSFLQWGATVFEPADLAGVLSSSSPMFDCPLVELFMPLSWGGTAVLADSLLDLPRLEGPVAVRFFMGAPTVVAELVASGGIPDSVRTIDLSGEAMPADLPDRIYRSTAVERVFNYYGISETTTHTIGTLVPRSATTDAEGTARSVPVIGRPIANTTAHVLDPGMNPVPVGLVGELYIGGAGVARGYLRNPELTAERFRPDPFSDVPDGRLYRSGDLARFHEGGTIEYLGRNDRQVKLRGFRIELGEVESALGQAPGVDRAVVVLREDEPGRKRLVAYVVAEPDGRPDPAGMRAFLRDRLPEHAVPTAFVALDQFPVTANGKIATAELPRPEYEAPGTVELWRLADAIETQVRMIWNDVLETGPVEFDARTSFFDLGGDSLLAIVMLGRIRDVFHIEVPVGTFMAASTIEDLSAILRADGWSMPRSGVVKVFGNADLRPFFCIHPGGGELYELRYLQKEFGERPVYALMPVGWNGEAEPLTSIEEMAIRYVDEIRKIQPHGPYLLAGLSLAGLIAYDMAQRFLAAGEEVAFLGLFETWPVIEDAVCLPEDAYEYESTAEAQQLAARSGQVVIPAQEFLYMKRLSPAIPALEDMQRRLEERKVFDYEGLCRELEDMRTGLQTALEQLKARGLVVNEMDVAAFYRMHEVAAKQIWAKAVYRPQPYPGSAVLFAGPSAELGLLTRVWSALVSTLFVETIDEEVHTELLRDPRLARALRIRIEEAEGQLTAAAGSPDATGRIG